MNFSKKFLEEVLNTIIVKVVSEMQRFVYFHAQFSPWVDLGRRALLALAKEKKNLQDMHGRYLLCKSRWVLGLKSCWNSQCARWKKVVLLDDVNAQFSRWKSQPHCQKTQLLSIFNFEFSRQKSHFWKFSNIELWKMSLWILAPKIVNSKKKLIQQWLWIFAPKIAIFKNSAI